MAEVKIIELGGWKFFFNPKNIKILDTTTCGKWMYFFDPAGVEFAENICRKAVQDDVVAEAKHTDKTVVSLLGSGVCCFYCDGSDIDQHKKIIAFFLANQMVRKTKTGKYYNLSFKFDTQTSENQYGGEFESKIKLADFIDLVTGEWRDNIQLDLERK